MRDKIIQAVIDVVEEGMRNSAPREIPEVELNNMIMAGRPALTDTATKIADRVLENE